MEYRKVYTINYYNSGINRDALVTSLMKMFEDIAIGQSEELGVGLDYYEKNKIGWMLARWKIDILKLQVLQFSLNTDFQTECIENNDLT